MLVASFLAHAEGLRAHGESKRFEALDQEAASLDCALDDDVLVAVEGDLGEVVDVLADSCPWELLVQLLKELVQGHAREPARHDAACQDRGADFCAAAVSASFAVDPQDTRRKVELHGEREGGQREAVPSDNSDEDDRVNAVVELVDVPQVRRSGFAMLCSYLLSQPAEQRCFECG